MSDNNLTDGQLQLRLQHFCEEELTAFALGGHEYSQRCGDVVNAIRELLQYRKADARKEIRTAHAEWSQATFGNVGPIGPLKHLSKEALEVAAKPSDLSEWADMQFLLWDAQYRAGFSDEQITQAMFEKLAINKAREWPVPKDGEPRYHVKQEAAPAGDYWYLVSWCGDGGRYGHAEIRLDNPWALGDSKKAMEIISDFNNAKNVIIKSVFPIATQFQPDTPGSGGQ